MYMSQKIKQACNWLYHSPNVQYADINGVASLVVAKLWPITEKKNKKALKKMETIQT